MMQKSQRPKAKLQTKPESEALGFLSFCLASEIWRLAFKPEALS